MTPNELADKLANKIERWKSYDYFTSEERVSDLAKDMTNLVEGHLDIILFALRALPTPQEGGEDD